MDTLLQEACHENIRSCRPQAIQICQPTLLVPGKIDGQLTGAFGGGDRQL